MKFVLRLGIAAAISAFTIAGSAFDHASAQTMDPFAAVGCSYGNYSCLKANGGQLPPEPPSNADFDRVGCAHGNFSCFRDKTGYTGP